MSRLDELIAELYPDGVEYKKLGDVATISRGGNFQKKDYVESGVPCIHYGQIYVHYNLFVSETISFISEEKAKKQKFAEPNDIIMAVTSENIDDVCKCIAWLGEEKVAVSGHSAIIHHTLHPKYLVYFLSSSMFYKQKIKLAHGTKVIEVTPGKLKDIILPVPPLGVQSEIVRILDNFTGLTAGLTAELTARKQQYEYYRMALLERSNDTCPLLPIPDFAHTYIGLVTTMTKHYVPEGVPLIHNSSIKENRFEFKERTYLDYEFAEKNASRRHKKGDVITVHTGDVGTSAIIQDDLDGSLGFATIVSRINDTSFVLPEWLCHCLNSKLCKNQITSMIKGDRNNLNLRDFNKLVIPIPPLEEQKRIISILSQFDTLIGDIASGIPAEIEARQRQYEYYRDKLLTFKQLA